MIKQFLSNEHTSTTRPLVKGSLIQQHLYDEYDNNRHTPKGVHSRSYDYKSDPIEKEKDWFSRAKSVLEKKREEQKDKESVSTVTVTDPTQFRYVGQVFSLFLLVEKESSLFLIDQHAAHERILYDELRSQKGSQPLMIPIEFEVERSIDTFLQEHSNWYEEFGIHIERISDLLWSLTAIVPHYKMLEKDIISSIQSYSGGNIEELHKLLYANTACKASIKDGDSIDDSQAIALIKKVFTLTYPVCPHGRNFVIEITREQLFSSVGRIV
jgi:DNA mismatch repair protein MutL